VPLVPGAAKSSRYVSHKLKKRLTCMKEAEIIYSAATVYSAIHASEKIRRYFGFTTFHTAHVAEVRGTYAVLHVKCTNSDDLSMPAVLGKTNFELLVHEGNANDVPMEDADKGLEDDLYSTDPQLSRSSKRETPAYNPASYTSHTWKCQSIEVKTEDGFVLGVNFGQDYRQTFEAGSSLRASLQMKRNPIPGIRQLKAIGRLIRQGDDLRGKLMQRFILVGGGRMTTILDPKPSEAQKLQENPKDKLYARLSAEEKSIFDDIAGNKARVGEPTNRAFTHRDYICRK